LDLVNLLELDATLISQGLIRLAALALCLSSFANPLRRCAIQKDFDITRTWRTKVELCKRTGLIPSQVKQYNVQLHTLFTSSYQ